MCEFFIEEKSVYQHIRIFLGIFCIPVHEEFAQRSGENITLIPNIKNGAKKSGILF